MDCLECRQLVSQYIDDELGDRQRRMFEQHVATCRDCAAMLEETRRVDSITHQTVQALRPDTGFAGRVLSELPPAGPAMRWQALLAVAIFVLLGAVVVSSAVFSYLLSRSQLPAEAAVFRPLGAGPDVPGELRTPFRVASAWPLGLAGPGVRLAFVGGILMSLEGKQRYRLLVEAGTVAWVRVGASEQLLAEPPGGGEVGPVRQALIDTRGDSVYVCNLWSKPLRSPAGDNAAGFAAAAGEMLEAEPLQVAAALRPLAKYLPDGVAVPLDWAASPVAQRARYAPLLLADDLEARALGAVAAGTPVALALDAHGETLLAPAAAERLAQPLRYFPAAWPPDDIAAVFAAAEGSCLGTGGDGKVYRNAEAAEAFPEPFGALEGAHVLHLPLQGYLLFCNDSGVSTVSIWHRSPHWRERRLKDIAGIASDGRGSVWLASRDGALIVLETASGKKKATYGPIGQALVSAPQRTAAGMLAVGVNGRQFLVAADGRSRQTDVDISGGHEGCVAANDGSVYFIRAGKWRRLAGGVSEALGEGSGEALLLADGRLLAVSDTGLWLLPEGRLLSSDKGGRLLIGAANVYHVAENGRISALAVRPGQ